MGDAIAFDTITAGEFWLREVFPGARLLPRRGQRDRDFTLCARRGAYQLEVTPWGACLLAMAGDDERLVCGIRFDNRTPNQLANDAPFDRLGRLEQAARRLREALEDDRPQAARRCA